jgi:serine/threonine protein kinase
MEPLHTPLADTWQLWAEIKLHGMLEHPNIVRFDECFEDEENVYMLLELCENGVSHCAEPKNTATADDTEHDGTSEET